MTSEDRVLEGQGERMCHLTVGAVLPEGPWPARGWEPPRPLLNTQDFMPLLHPLSGLMLAPFSLPLALPTNEFRDLGSNLRCAFYISFNSFFHGTFFSLSLFLAHSLPFIH